MCCDGQAHESRRAAGRLKASWPLTIGAAKAFRTATIVPINLLRWKSSEPRSIDLCRVLRIVRFNELFSRSIVLYGAILIDHVSLSLWTVLKCRRWASDGA